MHTTTIHLMHLLLHPCLLCLLPCRPVRPPKRRSHHQREHQRRICVHLFLPMSVYSLKGKEKKAHLDTLGTSTNLTP